MVDSASALHLSILHMEELVGVGAGGSREQLLGVVGQLTPGHLGLEGLQLQLLRLHLRLCRGRIFVDFVCVCIFAFFVAPPATCVCVSMGVCLWVCPSMSFYILAACWVMLGSGI